MKTHTQTSATPCKPLPPGLHVAWRVQSAGTLASLRTGLPVFVGLCAGTPPAKVLRFDRWQQFRQVFETNGASPWLAHAVRGFFENGGECCVVLPVQADLDAVGNDALRAETLADRLAAPFESGGAMDALEGIDLVCVPDAMRACLPGDVSCGLRIQVAAVDHCARMGDRFAILDALLPTHAEDAVLHAISQWQQLPAAHGALYLPWLRVKADVVDSGRPDTLLVPPCGHVAGVYARSDRRVGTHKAPANEPLEGVVDFSMRLDDTAHAELNDAGVNCLRERCGRGPMVWGARTLATSPALRYVNVTRSMLTLRRMLEQQLRDFTFEPDGPALWSAIADRLDTILGTWYRQGVLQGDRQADAYFIQCDAETNPADARDAGLVMAKLGLAFAVPAEFVIARITQSAHGGTTVAIEAQD